MFAHSLEGQSADRWEPLSQHLRMVGERTAGFAAAFCCSEAARAAGLLHDIGKASLEPGLFTLTVPTGGGKTLASLSFAWIETRKQASYLGSARSLPHGGVDRNQSQAQALASAESGGVEPKDSGFLPGLCAAVGGPGRWQRDPAIRLGRGQVAVLGFVSAALNTLADVVVAFAPCRIRAGAAASPGLVRRLREGSGAAMIAFGLASRWPGALQTDFLDCAALRLL